MSDGKTECGFQITYPNFSTKAFTMSYDDGPKDDARVMDLCREYGVQCTFALNTCNFGEQKYLNHLGYTVRNEKWRREEIAAAYAGFEVAGHSHTHPVLARIEDPERLYTEIAESNRILSELVGYRVCGFTYPCNSYNRQIFDVMREAGIVYGRTTERNGTFGLPDDFLRWNVSAHDHDTDLMQRIDEFAGKASEKLECLYVWGHSYEFQKPDPHIPGKTGTRWDDFERMIRYVSGLNQFWFASNIGIFRYCKAAEQLRISASSIHNPTHEVIYGVLNGKKIEIAPDTWVPISAE